MSAGTRREIKLLRKRAERLVAAAPARTVEELAQRLEARTATDRDVDSLFRVVGQEMETVAIYRGICYYEAGVCSKWLAVVHRPIAAAVLAGTPVDEAPPDTAHWLATYPWQRWAWRPEDGQDASTHATFSDWVIRELFERLLVDERAIAIREECDRWRSEGLPADRLRNPHWTRRQRMELLLSKLYCPVPFVRTFGEVTKPEPPHVTADGELMGDVYYPATIDPLLDPDMVRHLETSVTTTSASRSRKP